MKWFKSHRQDYPIAKFILTGGNIQDMAEQLGRIYFDQGGVLSQHFKLKHVPSVITQDGLRWKIQEVNVYA